MLMSELKDYLIQDYRDVEKYTAKMNRSGLANFSPLVITCAITGAHLQRESNPYFPATIEEQVQQTYDAYNAGASMVHIHCRDKNNVNLGTSRVEDYMEVNARIRAKCPDLIINNTAGGGRLRTQDGFVTPPSLLSIGAKPEVATIDVMGMPYRNAQGEGVYGITYGETATAVDLMRENGTKPEFECFDIGDLLYVQEMIRQQKLEGPYLIDLLIHPGSNYPTLKYMISALEHVPSNSVVSVLAIGAAQYPLLAAAIALGCNVRVGMEDNVYLGKGEKAQSNAQLVEKIVRIAKELGRPIATPAQAREMLGLGAPRQYSF